MPSVLVAYLLLAGTPVDERALANCAQMIDGMKRLECFDAATAALGKPKVLPPQSSGRWKIETKVSPVDDSQTVVARLRANSTITTWLKAPVVPTLVVRCLEHQLTTYIVSESAAAVEGGADEHTGTLRFDKEPAFETPFSESSDRQALFLEGSLHPSWFIAHRTMLFRFTPFDSSPAVMTFDLSGAEKALAPVFAACGEHEAVAHGDWLKVRAVTSGGAAIETPKSFVALSKAATVLAASDVIFVGCGGPLKASVDIDEAGALVTLRPVGAANDAFRSVGRAAKPMLVDAKPSDTTTLDVVFDIAASPACDP